VKIHKLLMVDGWFLGRIRVY